MVMQKVTCAPAPSPEYVFQKALAREVGLSRLLVAYISTGVVFMLLPGTFLGVWNLISISAKQVAAQVPAAWLQAHGHAQVFGWIGSFILGIGFLLHSQAAARSRLRSLARLGVLGTLDHRRSATVDRQRLRLVLASTVTHLRRAGTVRLPSFGSAQESEIPRDFSGFGLCRG